ncbi:MAG: OsmC family peroxiredoxin [Promethearchaeota archaeon]|nr:MAG: OsmC family peroxiredoxin [Candidatus Lokiarchaeota archaeon]
MSKKLVNDESITAYIERFKQMEKFGFTKKGDELFLSRLVAESEQVENLHVKSTINDLTIHNDAPLDLGGKSGCPSPMQSLLATHANCLEITALLYLSFSEVNVDSIKVKVEATLDKRSALSTKEAPSPGFFNMSHTWYVNSSEKPEKIEEVLKRVEEICPVGGTLLRSHEFKSKIVYNTI